MLTDPSGCQKDDIADQDCGSEGKEGPRVHGNGVAAVRVHVVDRVSGITVGVGVSSHDRVGRQEEPRYRVVHPNSRDQQTTEGVLGDALASEPAVPGLGPADLGVSVLVSVQHRRCDAGVQRKQKADVSVDVGELEDCPAGLGGGGRQAAIEAVDVARQCPGGGVLDDPAGVAAVAVVVVDLGGGLGPGGAAASLRLPGPEPQPGVELPGVSI